MPLRTADLDFDLPQSLIATTAAEPRDSAKLLVCSRSSSRLDHRTVSDLPSLLQPGDLLVFNASRVLPARFQGKRLDTGGKVQGLFLREADQEGAEPGVWVAMIRSRRFKEGAPIQLISESGRPGPTLTMIERSDDGHAGEGEAGAWILRCDDPRPAPAVLEEFGLTPLPPYILAARKAADQTVPDAQDRDRYQTHYADADEPRSVAAPTAGLHFTPDLLARLDSAGVERAQVLLHVGAGTFKPVETEHVEDHPMHAEWCDLATAREPLARARAEGRRVIAVGTTTARTLETFAALDSDPGAPVSSRLLITPGYEWRAIDAMMTNFHLPHSTLLAMVAALFQTSEGVAPLDRLKQIYAEAIAAEYRFFSYGDAMLVLP